VELITYMENILFTPMFIYFPDCLQKVLRKTLQGLGHKSSYRYVKTISMGDHSDKSLSVSLKTKIIEYTSRCSTNSLHESGTLEHIARLPNFTGINKLPNCQNCQMTINCNN
jgi:hypothetical protein